METAPAPATRAEPTVTCQEAIIPVSEVLARISSKWTVFVIGELSRGPMRFGELKREIGTISQKVLTATLRDLEKDGLIERRVTPSLPPRVDYELTELGRDLRGPIAVLSDWAFANRDRVEAARSRFAEREALERQTGW